MNRNVRNAALATLALASFVAFGFYLRGPVPEGVPTAPTATPAPTETPRAAEGDGKPEGFTFAYVGGGEEDDFESGCPAERVCLMGHFAPDLPVKVLLPNGDACTGRTGDAYNVADQNGEADFTALATFEGCMPTDVGSDGAVALVALPELMDANFKWLPVVEAGTYEPASLMGKDARALIDKFVAHADEAKQKTKLVKMTAGKLELVVTRSESAGKALPKNGPVFAMAAGGPVHLGEAEDICQVVSGAFLLGRTPYIVAETGPCTGDIRSNAVYEWTGTASITVASEGLYFP